ncbi:hypothetical protein PQ465_08090 [Sphingobacterium oryzagri]|uniref:Leucine-rich repeat domain-containing protein n=1 Tax=Sphingobacterium oryzagri TaxID=3025669 RepID=A0ABY7WL53_9SPHI|nr:hypothetical protein [Sphingobacterium sp. KACC 22765]WDF70327.1 hypothetical protein PQ465_08090 [Sphingobacterium sp. KACC 22765]
MMKNLNKLLFAFLLFCSATIYSCNRNNEINIEEEVVVDENNLRVRFDDANIETFIKEELNIAVNDSITRGKLKELTDFNIRGIFSDVVSLRGLEYATELTYIDFGNTQVQDLTPLRNLEKVTYLRMNNTPVVDLSPISNYTTLTYFNANQAGGITNISALSNNLNIEQIIIRGNPIGDGMMTTIARFEKLSRLNARVTGITNIRVLGELMAKGALLKSTAGYVDGDSEIDLRGNMISDFTPIQSYIDNGTAVPVLRD